MQYRLIALPFVSFLLAACTVGPDYHAPENDAPAEFIHAHASGLDQNKVAESEWWHSLNDPALTSLIETALSDNRQIEIAKARVRQARALRQAASAEGLPAINTDAEYQHQQISGNGPFFPRIPGVINRGPLDLFQAGFDASWELDLFGRIRRGTESAEAELAASESRLNDVLISVAAEVAKNYVELRANQQLADINRRYGDLMQQLTALAKTRADNGLATGDEVARSEAASAAIRAVQSNYRASAVAAKYRIGVLLGRQPEQALPQLTRDGAIPQVPEHIAVGLPSELLRRRPDVRAAEREVAAASARIGVATADLFPRLTLSGNFAVGSREVASWFSGDSTLFGVGPKLIWPIFDGGRIRARIEVRDAEQQAALAQYRQTVLQVLQEAETSLSNFENSRDELALRRQSYDAGKKALNLADIRYRQGSDNLIGVLQAQKNLYDSEMQLLQSKWRLASNLVAVYKALGGGWEKRGL